MLNNVLGNMELAKQEIWDNALNRLSDIVLLNKEVSSIYRPLAKHKKQYLQDLHRRNEKANIIYEKIIDNKDINYLYHFISFWAYESTLNEYTDSSTIQSTLFQKLDLVSKGLNKQPKYNNVIDRIAGIVKKYNSKINDYLLDYDSVVILTAVPIEFISIVRKFDLFLTSSNTNYLEYLLRPDIGIEEKKENRQNISVTGVLNRGGKRCKVRVLMLKNYGALDSINYLSNFKEEYSFRNEIILMGIAGQLEKRANVKIGHLVISDGFYDAYYQKFDKEGLNFQNTIPNPLCEDYNSVSFNWENWIPSTFSILNPEIPKDHVSFRYCYNKTVHKGKFVSFHAVNKQTYSKKNLMYNFKESLAVEMEGTGCFKFIEDNQEHLKLKIIKAVCDWSDESKSKEWQPYCAEIAAEFTVDYLISKYGKI